MKRQSSFKGASAYGTLFLVPTPIGNLGDMTFRAVETLKNVDLIAAEDTRTTGLLLKHFAIETRQTALHEHNWLEKIPKLLATLKSGKSIAQVSDAGMPSISDPGHELVLAALDAEISVVSLPGASAGITALIASGLASQPFTFHGFLPRKKNQQRLFLEQHAASTETQIFYESPLRLVATLANLLEIYGEREIVIARELTKIYEEYLRGTPSELLSALTETPVRGECVLMVSGQSVPPLTEFTDTPLEAVHALIEAGTKPNDAIKQIAKARDLNRQALYTDFHNWTHKEKK
ncbi:MAG: 16S rRNA (cytidine(1402)-2'-O)-methyltransferase [Streptococcaceae bacterium]|jgi:16S rRNA (cytidine1402-2'-O)-methyltransferase|nr:16S rRNA (cytidine(1402)-2'-O)-methyltransferase [Streptococcaceae bacterium]